MVDKTLSTIVGGGGNGLIFPMTSGLGTQVGVRDAVGFNNMFTALAYTDIESDHSPQNWDAATFIVSANANEQTILDLTSQSGLLTTIVTSPHVDNNGIVTVRITADGVVTTIPAKQVSAANSIAILGGFLSLGTLIGTDILYGTTNDIGYDSVTDSTKILILTPAQAIERGGGGIGIVFKDSLKVTVQGDGTGLVAGSATSKAVAAWLTSVPGGL